MLNTICGRRATGVGRPALSAWTILMATWAAGCATVPVNALRQAPSGSQEASQASGTRPQAAPAPKPAADTTHFAVIGDFGEAGINEERVATLVRGWQPEFIVTTGDNNYPNGTAQTIDANIGQYYGGFIKFGPNAATQRAGATHNAFYPCLGNHDWRATDAAPYLAYFNLPGNGRYYTFTRGPVDFFMVDSDPHEPDGIEAASIQGRWLEAALHASRAPWKVVVLHHPPYSSGRHGSSVWMQWPFKAWGADLVLSGHDHTYEHLRMDGLDYIVMGLSGAKRDHFRIPCALPHASVDTCFDADYGALRCEATAAQLSLMMTDWQGQVQDTVTLTRAPNAGSDGGRARRPPFPAK